VAFGKILPEEIINLPKLKTLNVHPSLLPKYRGPSPIKHAILNGETETGSSIMLETVAIDADDNDFTLADKLARVSAKLLLKTIDEYAAGKIQAVAQNEAEATHSKMISKADGKINWQKSATEIYNQFRAFYPWPGIWTTWNGKKIQFTDCVPEQSDAAAAAIPGTVLDGGLVACGQGTLLKIKQLKPEGKSEMGMADFLNGYRDFVGSQLE
jgi:methionyl-tRNA formyltransferase